MEATTDHSSLVTKTILLATGCTLSASCIFFYAIRNNETSSTSILSSIQLWLKSNLSFGQKSKTSFKKHQLGPADYDLRFGGLTYVGEKDDIYDESGPKPFKFNKEVAQVFDDMVSRSVPLYREVNDFLLYWVHKYYQPGTAIVDLGCSTGTTFDLICKSYTTSEVLLTLVGVDNSQAMVDKCQKKLEWASDRHDVKIVNDSISKFALERHGVRASFVILNYTLQFLPLNERAKVIKNVLRWLQPGGVLFISEKLSYSDHELHETVTNIYEDFKLRRGYTKNYIARKKEALMNVLVPYTEDGLRLLLKGSGFEQVDLAMKWNNFATFTARKPLSPLVVKPLAMDVVTDPKRLEFKYIDRLFDSSPDYLTAYFHFEERDLVGILGYRQKMMEEKGNLGNNNLAGLNRIAKKIIKLRKFLKLDTSTSSESTILGILETINLDSDTEASASVSSATRFNLKESKGSESSAIDLKEDGIISLCEKSDLFYHNATSGEKHIYSLIKDQIPWKKGPVKILDVLIDAEWRSDIKWKRLMPWLPSLGNKTVCDIGCNNGYFMFQMINSENASNIPKLVVGVEPSLNCQLQFEFMKRLSRSRFKNRLKFELGKGDMLSFWKRAYDVVFCLGVLYHTPDPISMLRDIHASLKPGGYVFVDCQGIITEGNELPLCLFPKKRYANMKGVYFLPNVEALKNWLSRSSFADVTVIFQEKLSPKEQRITSFAPVNSSLRESLDERDPNMTKEGYPAPYRFYIRAKKG